MSRVRFPLVALAAVAAVAVGAGGTGAATHARKPIKLYGQTGPGFTIKLTNYGFERIRRLKPGLYTFTIQDRATNHNFHLVGPGLDKKTSVRFVGTKFWRRLSLKKGTYRYFCDPHKKLMHGSFVVR